MRGWAGLIGALVLLGCAGSARLTAPPDATALDVERFLGRWYIIAHVPYWAERGKVGSYVEYRARPDGRYDDLYYFRRDALEAPVERWEGVAWILDPPTARRWKARFLWPLSTEFWVLEVDPEYRTALIGTPDRRLAWIYARSPELDPERLAGAKRRLGELGYPVDAMVPIPQRPSEAR